MSIQTFRRAHALSSVLRRGGLAASAMTLILASAACHTPYRYQYEQKTGVGLRDRANDYCQRSATKQGYTVMQFGPDVVDAPGQVDVRMDVHDGDGALTVSCSFDDVTRIAAIPRPQRASEGNLGYMKSDAGKARETCDRAVKGSGYDAHKVSVAEWNGGRQYRVNVAVRQGGADRTVGCRYDGVAGTAVVPPVTK
jgi:hypothetical protein